jgi:hypothetical protein
MKIKKWMFLMLIFLLGISAGMNAQVNIGSEDGPKAGAVLDLSQGSKSLGLILPNVELDNVSQWQLDEGPGKTSTSYPEAGGTIVYNKKATTTGGNGAGLYIWDGGKWRALSSDGGSMSTSPDVSTLPPVSKDGGSVDITVTGPGADGLSGNYTYVVIAGSDYAQVSPAGSADGQFTLTFEPNYSAAPRKAIVMVTDPAGKTASFVFNQNGDPTACQGSTNPAITSTGTTLGSNGAVYLSVTTPENGVNYVWTRNGAEVGDGSYYIATQAGSYIVYAGSVGCTYKSAALSVTASGTTAPDAVTSVVAGNGGVLCGGNTVTLTALGVSGIAAANLIWFKDGIQTSKTGASITVDEAGDWYVVVKDGSNYSKPSNTSTVVAGGSGSQVTLDPADVKVNGTAIANFTSYCKGSSLYLTVDAPQAGITYKWYNGNDLISNTNPYIVPADQDAILLRLVASDNSGSLCPAEANSTEKTISAVAPVAPNILGDNSVCSGSSTTLVANGAVDAVSYEWFVNGVKSASTGNSISAQGGNSYTVRYTQSGGCTSALSAPFTLTSLGAPAIDWDQFVTQVNPSNTYTFSVKSTGSATPSAYTWSADPAGNVTFTPANPITNSAQLKFSGDATVTVTPENNCGPGSAVTKAVAVIAVNLPAVTISTPNDATSFCGGVVFTITRPATGWTDAEWKSLSANNVSATVAGSPKAGTFSSDGTKYYYALDGTTAGAAVLTVAGSIGSKPVVSASSASITLSNTVPAGSFAISGTSCFDIAYAVDGGSCGVLATRATGRAQFGSAYSYDYVLTGSVGGGIIQSVTWSYTDQNNAVISFVPAATSTTVNSNKSTLKYDASLLTTSLGEIGIKVKVTAVVIVTGGACGYTTYTVSQDISIKDCQCCPGYLAIGGEYLPGNTAQYLAIPNNTTFATLTNQSGSWKFAPTGKDLCFYKTDAKNSTTDIWNNAASTTGGCAASTDYVPAADRGVAWRMPNIAELGAIHSVYNKLDTQPTSILGTTNMKKDAYHSSTLHLNPNVNVWRTLDGAVGLSNKTSNSYYIRCVSILD